MTRKRIRNVPIYVWVRQDELEAIQDVWPPSVFRT